MQLSEPNAIIDLLDQAYDPHADDATWDARISDAVTTMAGAVGGMLMRLTTSFTADGSLFPHGQRAVYRSGRCAQWSDATLQAMTQPAIAEVTFGRTVGTTFSTLSGAGAGVPLIPGWRDCWNEPVVDSFGLVSRDARGDVFLLSTGLVETTSTSTREVALFTKLAAHLGHADRLRRRKGAGAMVDRAEAVLSPRGKLLHTEKPQAKAALDEGLERRAFAQKNRDAPERALEVWQGLVAGRWSLVDFFDTDGKRLVLAMKNAPTPKPRKDLTPRERRVAALVAMGHRDKEIAYMLGLSLAAVTTSLRRARVKLGVKSRAELATTWRRTQT